MTTADVSRTPTRRRFGRAVAALATGLVLIAVAGCSSVTTSGTAIADPTQPLAAALERLKQDNSAAIEQGSTTVGDATHCFYQLPAAEADDVTDEVACGPIRRLGKAEDQVWDHYRLTYTWAADGQLTGAVDQVRDTATAVDPSLLVAADDTTPAAADQVPAPQAPPTTVINTATMLPAGSSAAQSLGTFRKLDEPVRLLTPSASIEVTAMAEPTMLPAQMFAGDQEEKNPSPAYRPAEGQQAYAFEVTVGPGTDRSKLLSTSAESRITTLSTALSVAAGDETIAIADASTIPNEPDAGTLTVPCQSEDGESFPCSSERSGEGVLAMTIPADSEPALVAAVAKEQQSVGLPDGKLSSDVSQLEYQRSAEPQKIGETVEIGPVSAPSDDEGKKDQGKKADKKKGGDESRWRFDLDSAGLAAFDPYRGWAPKGRAWLVLATSGYQQTGKGNDGWQIDRVASLGVAVDGTTVEPNGLDADYFDGRADADVNWVFEVPADIDTAELRFRPTGVYTGGEKDKDFSTKTVETYKITLQK